MLAAGTSLPKQQVRTERGAAGVACSPLCVWPLFQPTQLGGERKGVPNLCTAVQINPGHQASHEIRCN